jgi:hypothetical protein
MQRIEFLIFEQILDNYLCPLYVHITSYILCKDCFHVDAPNENTIQRCKIEKLIIENLSNFHLHKEQPITILIDTWDLSASVNYFSW